MFRIITVTVLLLCTTSCSTSPADITPFIEKPELLRNGSIFHRTWKKDKTAFSGYTKFAVRQVNTEHMREFGWWEKRNVANRDDIELDGYKKKPDPEVTKNIAWYFEKTLKSSFEKTPENRLQYISADKADNKTLIIELAIVELVPIKRYMKGAGLIGDGSLKGGTIAFEGKIVNSKGILLAMLTDRKVHDPDHTLYDQSPEAWYLHAKPAINNWSTLIVGVLNGWEKDFYKEQ